MEAVSLGHHLNPPEGCPDVIRTIMLECWKPYPNDRIKFSTIVENLSEDNLKEILDTSNSTYGKLRPNSNIDKNKHLYLSRVDKCNLVEKNKVIDSEQTPLMAKEEPCETLEKKLSCDQISVEFPENKQIDVRTPETEYTIILANNDLEEEEE